MARLEKPAFYVVIGTALRGGHVVPAPVPDARCGYDWPYLLGQWLKAKANPWSCPAVFAYMPCGRLDLITVHDCCGAVSMTGIELVLNTWALDLTDAVLAAAHAFMQSGKGVEGTDNAQ